MFSDLPFETLMDRLQRGEPAAANEVFDRFAKRLLVLARSRLSPALASKVDPEDVLQSVMRSFFEAGVEGRFEVRNWDALWAILVVITVRKCHKLWRHYKTGRRDVAAESVPTENDDGEMTSAEGTDREPLPEEAVALTELVERLLLGLDTDRRPVLELRLQGYTVEEIAGRTGISERTIHRVLSGVREQLRGLLT